MNFYGDEKVNGMEKTRRSIPIYGINTPVTLNAELWEELKKVAEMEKCSIRRLCEKVKDSKSAAVSLNEALEIAVEAYLRVGIQSPSPKGKK